MPRAPALRLVDVGLDRDGHTILDGIGWTVTEGQRWVVLGPNGSGKTSLIRIASLYLHPSRGTVEVLGQTLGRTDVRRLRRRVGLASASMADLLRPTLTACEVVMTARHGALEPWWHDYDRHDRDLAATLLARLGIEALTERTFGTLSSGERQRVLLARTLMPDPGLVLLDEPTAGLDLAGREQLVADLARLARDPATPPSVLVTHHVDEIPPGFTHALLLRRGWVLAAGPLAETVDSAALSELFDLDVHVEQRDGRWSARAGAPITPPGRPDS